MPGTDPGIAELIDSESRVVPSEFMRVMHFNS